MSLVIDVALSNEEPILSNDKLMIYPNPNKGNFTIENKNGLEINAVEIFDVSGRLITKNKLSSPSNKTNINLNHVDSGVYFVKIHVYGTTSTRRIIIE
ncbi:T9SS type A sorting domain-containing protein [uncultured Algibacter sp.]|uniref:T9SS type A sorting domain-containing protein n=1 Tax=uncultured Algibacter sp. TaxID=298659 RepID=UPI002617E04B|nr:T9SS type A sorting domain-containing protein [uncultured Algibacter sp.]